jgi:ribosomal protein L22
MPNIQFIPNAAREAIASKDMVLATLQINGSRVDSGEIDFRINCEAMGRVCADTNRKHEVLCVLKTLMDTILDNYPKRLP